MKDYVRVAIIINIINEICNAVEVKQSINQSILVLLQQKQQLTQPQPNYLRQECDHYCPGRKLECLVKEE